MELQRVWAEMFDSAQIAGRDQRSEQHAEPHREARSKVTRCLGTETLP